MQAPKVLNECETINRAVKGMSLARFGDGELRLCVGGDSVSQRTRNPMLIQELKLILGSHTDGLLVCIPDYHAHGPKRPNWQKYATPKYVKLYGDKEYGSAFVTRPDSSPWINVPAYWARVRQLWADKDVTLVVGDHRSLTKGMLTDARSCRIVWGPTKEAYAEIDRIEAEIGTPSGPVIMCLGATATVLAWRLARKGVHALDLGHIGMFMRRLGVTENATA